MKPARFGKRLKVKEDIDTLWDIHQSQKEEIFKTLGIEKPASFESTIAERKNAIEEVCPEYKDILKKLVDISANLILKTPPKYIFHDFEHTFIYVLSQTEELLENSDLNSEEKKVVYIAAIAHDLGHLIGREDHEKYSKRIVQKLMERYEVSDKEKEAINLVITSTKFPHAPELNIDEELKTQYQKIQTMIYIMRDADIGHIASSNFE